MQRFDLLPGEPVHPAESTGGEGIRRVPKIFHELRGRMAINDRAVSFAAGRP